MDIEDALAEYREELQRERTRRKFEMSIPQPPATPAQAPSPFNQKAAASPSGIPASSPVSPGATPLPPGANSNPDLFILPYSLENVEESSRLKYGEHAAYIEDVKPITAQTGSHGLEFKLRFINYPGVESNNENAGRSGIHRIYFTEKSLWKAKNTFVAVGQDDAITAFNMAAARNVLVMVDVTENRYTPEGKSEVVTAKCDSLMAWPDQYGGPGAKFQPVPANAATS